jgi:hypothetical protein
MNLAARIATPVLRSAAGEPPLGAGGAFFRDDQGELFEHPSESYRTPATLIGVLELEGGTWLARPPSFHVTRPQYQSRDAALRAAIASMVRRARKFMKNGEGEGTHWTEGFAGRVIEWALSLKPAKISYQGAAADAAPRSGHPGIELPQESDASARMEEPRSATDNSPKPEITDPVIRELVAAHRARKIYPAGHTFSMTNPVIWQVL